MTAIPVFVHSAQSHGRENAMCVGGLRESPLSLFKEHVLMTVFILSLIF